MGNITKEQALVELYNRGVLPAEKAQVVEELINRGAIENPTDRRKKLAMEESHMPERKPPSVSESFMEDAGQMAGGIALPAAAMFAASPPGAIGMMSLAALGGMGGKGWQNVIESQAGSLVGEAVSFAASPSLDKLPPPVEIYNTIFKPEVADSTLDVALDLAKAGGEEFALEGAGQVMNKVLGGMYHVAFPKMDEGVKGLQKQMVKYGGGFTKAEMTEAWTTQMMDSIARGSAAGKRHMLRQDQINAEALKAWQKDVATEVAQGARTLDNEQFGKLVKEVVEDGEGTFQAYMGQLYGSFDELVATKFVEKSQKRVIQSEIVDAGGQPITREVIENYVKEMKPVDLRPLKKSMDEVEKRLQETANLGRTEWGGEQITKILQLDDAVRFSTAQNARSYIMALRRSATRENDPSGKLRSTLVKAEKELTKAMDSAARAQGDDVFRKYQAIKKEANEGYSAFRAELVTELVSDRTAATKLGNKLFRDGNVDQIRELRRALEVGEKYTGIPAEATWKNVKSKYMEAVIRGGAREKVLPSAAESLSEMQARTGVMDAVKLAEYFNPASPKNAVFKEMFSRGEQQRMFQLAKALGINQTRSAAGLSMLVQIMQGGLVAKGAHDIVQGKVGAAATKVAGAVLPIDLVARLMVSPKWNSILLSAAKTSPTAKNAPIIAMKLYKALEEAEKEAAGEQGSADKAMGVVGAIAKDVGKTAYEEGSGALKKFMAYPQ